MKRTFLFLFFGLTILIPLTSQNYPNILNYYINGTPSNGVKIKTNFPFTDMTQMPTININGYAYGNASVINLSLVYYIYNGSFIQHNVSSYGNYTPKIFLSNEDGKVVIFIDDKCYYERFTVSVYANGMGSNNSEWFQGWTAVDESLSGNNITEVYYNNKFKRVDVEESLSMFNDKPLSWLDSSGYAKRTMLISQANDCHLGHIDTGWGGMVYLKAGNGTAFTVNGATGSPRIAMLINNEGNVGIGTTNPQSKLDIVTAPDSTNSNKVIASFTRYSTSAGGSGLVNLAYGISKASLELNSFYTGTGRRYGSYGDLNIISEKNGQYYAGINLVTNDTSRINVKKDGKVGIGTTNPSYKLQVSGSTTVDGVFRVNGKDSINGQKVAAILGDHYQSYTCFGAPNGGRIRGSNEGYLIIEGNPNGYGDKSVYINSYTSNGNVLMTAASGKVGVGINVPLAKFSVNGSYGNPSKSGTTQPAIASFGQNNNNSTLYIGSSSTSPSNTMWFQASSRSNLSINYPISLNPNGGYVGIGTINPQNALDVRGTIRASEVKVVDINQIVPDFVFDKNYILPSLNDVESYVNKNRHLPNIPSATEVKENGMSLVDMNLKLLQKVEELTLYVIEQQKQIDELKSKVK